MLIDKTLLGKEYKLLIEDAILYLNTLTYLTFKVVSDGVHVEKTSLDGDVIAYRLNLKVLKNYASKGKLL